MNQIVAAYLANSLLNLSATDRLILMALADHVAGMRIEDIAAATGSKFRWIARQVSKLARMGILHRVSPGKYAIADCVVAETLADDNAKGANC